MIRFAQLAVALGTACFAAARVVNEREINLLKCQNLADVYTQCTAPNTVALTFHDGPSLYTRHIVDTLNANDAKGTFFVNGYYFNCIYDDLMLDGLRYAFESGHLIGGHTWQHINLTSHSWEQIVDDIQKLDNALEKILGIVPAWFRPPNGEYNDQVREAVALHNQAMVIWDFNSGDTKGLSVNETNALYDDLAARRPSNALTLNHEVRSSTAFDTLPYAIQRLKEKGYKFVTVAECLGNEVEYQKVTQPSERDDTWTCHHNE